MQLTLLDPLRQDAQALHRALGELTRAYQFRDRDRICCYGLSVSQCYALDSLIREGGLMMNQLAAELFIDKSTASRIVRGLEGKGMVVRTSHPSDGRAVILEASAEGRRVNARIQEDILCEEERVLSQFDEDVRREIPKLVSALARAASARVDTSGGCCRLR